jgi:pimeloyl-ACP methyl ester carboxylesterase
MDSGSTAARGSPGKNCSAIRVTTPWRLAGDHYVHVINSSNFQTKPVAVGHSFGGLIAQRLLAANHVAAAVGDRSGTDQGSYIPTVQPVEGHFSGTQQPR